MKICKYLKNLRKKKIIIITQLKKDEQNNKEICYRTLKNFFDFTKVI